MEKQYHEFSKYIYENNFNKAIEILHNMHKYDQKLLLSCVEVKLFSHICKYENNLSGNQYIDICQLIDDILNHNKIMFIKFEHLLIAYLYDDNNLCKLKTLLSHSVNRSNSDLKLMICIEKFYATLVCIRKLYNLNKFGISNLFENLIYDIDKYNIIVNFMKLELLPKYAEDVDYCYNFANFNYNKILNELRISNSDNREYSLPKIIKFNKNKTTLEKVVLKKCKILIPKIKTLYVLYTLSSNMDNNINLYGLPIEIIHYITQILIDLHFTIVQPKSN